MPELTIQNVDLTLLESQRLTLAELSNLLHNQRDGEIGNYHLDALDGVLAMLDEWSDDLYFKGIKP